MFVFGYFNVHHKDWLTYSGGTDKPGEPCHNFSISNDLTQMVNFLTRISDCDTHSPALLDLFISSDASICSIGKFRLYCFLGFHWLSKRFKMRCPNSSHSPVRSLRHTLHAGLQPLWNEGKQMAFILWFSLSNTYNSENAT